MSFDPTDPSGRLRPRSRPRLARRDFLRGGLWLGVGIGSAPILSACNNAHPAVQSAPYALARPDSPVTLPLRDSNPPIDDGLEPETGGAFKLLNYEAYMAPGVMKDFGARNDVEVQVTPYSNYDEMLAKLRTHGESFDLVFPGPNVLSKMVYAELLQPLNHSYVPNLENVWREYQDPWYDRGARYTVPYTIYGTGVMYRADRVSSIPDDGYDLMWDDQYSGKVYLLDDTQEAIGMSLLRNDLSTDINTGDPAAIQEATNSLIELIDLVNVKTTVSAYSLIPEGTATIHQAWSGDPIAGQYYLPKGETPEVLGYWRPDDPAERVIGSDNIAIPKSAAKPVLSHMMINDLLDNDIALQNFGFNGYQPPLTKLSAPYLVDQGLIPANLTSAIVLPKDFDAGLTFYEVDPSTDALWRQFWSEFKAGG
jgi:spermidine/putrescine transport system substrate-binding protein